jgi:bacterioferritin (cytochrome b1)
MLTEPFPDPGRRAAGRHREPDRDFEHRVLQLLEHHGANEGALLEAYQEIAEQSDTDAAVRFLIELILNDEHRHHEVFEQMANAVRSFIWEVPVEPRLPAPVRRDNPELHAATAELLRAERQDRKELKALRSTLRHDRNSTFDALMVDVMLHDTEKHIAILEYIHDHLSR